MARLLTWVRPRTRHLDHYLFVLHRITGLILALYLIIHVIDVARGLVLGQPAWEELLYIVKSPIGKIVDFAVAFSAGFHGANGLRLVLIQYFGIGLTPAKSRFEKPKSLSGVIRTLVYIGLIAFGVFTAYAFYFIITTAP